MPAKLSERIVSAKGFCPRWPGWKQGRTTALNYRCENCNHLINLTRAIQTGRCAPPLVWRFLFDRRVRHVDLGADTPEAIAGRGGFPGLLACLHGIHGTRH